MRSRRTLLVAAALAGVTAVAGCSSGGSSKQGAAHGGTMPSMSMSGHPSPPSTAGSPSGSPQTVENADSPLPGMPPVTDPQDIYAADRPGMLSPAVQGDRNLVYVPNTLSNDVSVIDPATYKVIYTFPVGRLPQHVVPSYDLKTLWVNNNNGNSLTPIDPRTGQPGKAVPVEDPYNLYFTPDGKDALVMAERDQAIDWRDPHTMALIKHMPTPGCKGVNHADFSANGRYFIATCEFSGGLIKVDVEKKQIVGLLQLAPGGGPQDVKTSPDGKVFYVADMNENGVWTIDGNTFTKTGFIPTGKGAHGLYVSRDSRYLYVSNRGEGSISLIDLHTGKVATKWRIPGGGSPDMGGVSADGKVLWLSGRYNGVVYAISTVDGHLIAKIPVGRGPHGLCVYPQPGRYSLGHTGVFR